MSYPTKLSDSVVVITGASSGIGRATALAFARRGATVLLAARRVAPLRDLAQECAHLGGRAQVVPTDVTDEGAVRALAEAAIENHGYLDVWVNNAAVSLFSRFEEAPLEVFRRVIETNLLGYVHGARAALQHFREQGRGVLINVSSIAGKSGQPYTSAYCASKFAINGLSSCLRQELMDERNIHVCTILADSVDTPLFQHAANYTGRAIKPLEPLIHPGRVAQAIVHCVRKPRDEVIVGISSRQVALMHTLSPELSERQMARKVEEDHFEQKSAPPTSGNIFEAMPEWTSVDGGWKRAKRSQRIGLARNLLGAMGLAVAPAGLGGRLGPFQLGRRDTMKRR